MTSKACFVEHGGYIRVNLHEHDDPVMKYERAWFAIKAVIAGFKNKEQIECLADMWTYHKYMGVSYDADTMSTLTSIFAQ